MIATPDRLAMTSQEYLAWEAQQLGKYEYIEGVAYAMTGGTIPHNDIALNVYNLLRPHLRARGCRVNVADVKVKVSATGPYFIQLIKPVFKPMPAVNSSRVNHIRKLNSYLCLSLCLI